ncbi:MAG: hypothetical protein JW768_08055 [Chitinispirillaceae bacterium]|nr:hypothetical protein [Chitinispirillaceae bacterium]
MSQQLDQLIERSLDLRKQVQALQSQYDDNRRRILEIMAASDQKTYFWRDCRVLRTEEVSIESVSKPLLIQALKEVDIPRDKKVFIWNRAVREIKRPSTVLLQTSRGPSGSEHPAAALLS